MFAALLQRGWPKRAAAGDAGECRAAGMWVAGIIDAEKGARGDARQRPVEPRAGERVQ